MSVLGKALQTSREIETCSSAAAPRVTFPNGRDRAAKFLVLAFIISGLSACSTGTTSVTPSDDVSASSEAAFESAAEVATPADETADITADSTLDTEPTTEEVAAANGMIPAESYGSDTMSSDVSTETLAIDEVAAAEVAPVTAPAVLHSMSLEQKPNKPSFVVLGMSEPTSYHISQTTPTEFVLTLSGATLEASAATAPQILPQGVPGIRSVRASQSGSDTMIRMFVDSGMTLAAADTGPNKITITSVPVATAGITPVIDTDARAQLQPPADGAAAPAAGDASKPAVELKENDNTARENPTGLVSSDGSKVYTGRLISLDLQDTDIDNALRIIAEVSNLNIIASDDVTGKVTLRLIDVPWDQALDVILKTNGLDQVTEGNVIRIAPIEKLRQEREALKEAKKAQEALEDLSVRYIRISYARASELKEQVESVLSERGTVSVDERTNQLIIKDVKKGQAQAADLLKRLDLRTPQVLLETQIVESGRNILRDLGFQWSFTENHSPATGNATGLNFPNAVTISGSNAGVNEGVSFPAATSATEGFGITALLDSADGSRTIGARLSALERERAVKVVSRPQVATVNNKQAEISSVETLRVRLPSAGTAISTGSGASASSGAATAFEEIKVGIELKVTPQASPDYFVLLDIAAKSSTLGNRAVDNIPSTIDRTANSTVLIKSGQTFALGGVYRLNDSDSVTGVPFIKDIPFLGHFFRRTFFDKSDEELIFFITPHIVEGSFDAAAM